MRRKLTEIWAELAAEKAASNRGRGRESGPTTPPQSVWVGQVKDYGEAVGERGSRRGQQHRGGYGITRYEGGSCQGEEGDHL